MNAMEKSFRDAVFFGSGVLAVDTVGKVRHVPREELTGVTHYRGYVIVEKPGWFEIRWMGVLMSRHKRPATIEDAKAFVDVLKA